MSAATRAEERTTWGTAAAATTPIAKASPRCASRTVTWVTGAGYRWPYPGGVSLTPVPDLESLRARGAAQQPHWPDPEALDAAVTKLRSVPPLVFAGECDELKTKLAAVARGEAFLLQGGDCAETFDGVTADNVRNKLRVLLQMAVVLTYAASVPVVKLGRIAGQYAKPRSSDDETRDGVTLPAYRGDAVNGYAFTPESRVPDPQRLVEVYHSSAATLNLVRAFVTGGYADLRQVHTWNTDFVRSSAVGRRYEKLGQEIDRALTFMQAIGADPDEFHRVDFHSSHEALILEYEHALTRIDSRTQTPYDVSGHFVWIGERTRQLDGAHVELLSHIRNPIGVKLGPTTSPDDAIALAERLNPDNEPGRLTFITRMGAGLDPRPAAQPGGEGDRGRRDRGLGLRPDARQHLRGLLGLQDPSLRRRRRGGPGLLRRAPDAGHLARWRARGADRRRRHRVRRGWRGTAGGRPRPPLRVGVRPSSQPGAVAGAGVPGGRDAARGGPGERPRGMSEPLVDLRSDTLTRPTQAMRAAMAGAEVGDDVYQEDPTVRRLEERVAELFGHQAALFCPTGSMANVLAVRTLVGVGEEVLCEASAHIARAELGAHGALVGLTMRTWMGRPVEMDQIERMHAPDMGPFFVTTRAIAMENTHNFGGGAVTPIEDMQAVRRFADDHGIGVHVDGARIWNAHVATGTPLTAYGATADVLAVCLSKGLGAPVGSLVVGSAEAIAESRVWRKRLGGGMRQVGILAAAGLHALDHHVERLAEDHAHARLLADACGLDPAAVDTNIVVVDVPDAAAVVTRAREHGVLVSAVGPRALRMVTHLDVSRDDAEAAASVLATVLTDR